jgi:hypothetical protein
MMNKNNQLNSLVGSFSLLILGSSSVWWFLRPSRWELGIANERAGDVSSKRVCAEQ